jgi:hypothetical protein
MDPYWDLDNNVTSDAFFAKWRESELAMNEGDGLPPMNNNEAGRWLWRGGRILESAMDHIMEGDYPRLRYPHFQPMNGGSCRGGTAIREHSPPRGHLRLVRPRPEWQVPPEYAVAAQHYIVDKDTEEYVEIYVSI